MKEKLTELIKQAKYCTEEELAEYLISAGLVLPTRCKECRYYNEDSEYCGMWGECRHPEHFCDEGAQEESLGTIVDDILRLKAQLHDEIDFDYNAEDC